MSSIPFGIRHAADATGRWSEYTLDSVKFANDALAGTGKRFYFDQADYPWHEIDGLRLHDMYGWVVPDELADRFVPVWLAGADLDLDEYEYATVEFHEGEDGRPVITFDTED